MKILYPNTINNFENMIPISDPVLIELSETEVQEPSEKYADLIQHSRLKYDHSQSKSAEQFKNSFGNIPEDLLEKALQSFRENYKRRYKFRVNEQHHFKWFINENGNIDNINAPIYFLEMLGQEDTIKKMEQNGFFRHHSSVVYNWGQHIKLRNSIFERYIVNDANAPKNYYIHGGLGVGKTTLLTSIARMLLKILNINVVFITMPQLTKLVTSISKYDKESLDRLLYCSFLFIDDIGQEKYTTDNQESLMRDFFVNRYSNNMPMFIAGNIDIKDREQKGIFYTQLVDYMNDKNKFEVIKIEGGSRRK